MKRDKLILVFLLVISTCAAKTENERIEINCHYDNLNNEAGKQKCISDQKAASREIHEWVKRSDPILSNRNAFSSDREYSQYWEIWMNSESGKLYSKCKSEYDPDNVAVSFCIGAR